MLYDKLKTIKKSKIIEFPDPDKKTLEDLRKIEQIRRIAITFNQGARRVEFKQFCARHAIQGMQELSPKGGCKPKPPKIPSNGMISVFSHTKRF